MALGIAREGTAAVSLPTATVEPRLVLFTTNHPYAYTGGETMFVAPELPHLAAAFGARVTVVPLHASGKRLEVPDGVDVDLRLADDWRRRRALHTLLAWTWPGFGAEMLRALRSGGAVGVARVWRWAAVARAVWHWLSSATGRDAPLLLYTYWRGGATLASARWSATHAHAVAVTRVHRYELYDEAFVPPFQPWTSVHERLRLTIPIAGHGADYLHEKRGLSRDRIALARLGVAAAKVRASASTDGAWRIVSCSAISAVKRVPFTAQVLVALALRHPGTRIEWLHFGDGPERDLVRQALADAPANLHARLAGRVDNAAVRAHYAERPVDLFMLLSASEGLPVAIQEALAAGVPVLATDVGGVRDAVPPSGDNGALLASNADASAAVAAIEQLMTAPPPQRDARRRAAWQRWADAFDPARNHAALARTLRELMDAMDPTR